MRRNSSVESRIARSFSEGPLAIPLFLHTRARCPSIRFGTHNGLKSDIAPSPKSADRRHLNTYRDEHAKRGRTGIERSSRFRVLLLFSCLFDRQFGKFDRGSLLSQHFQNTSSGFFASLKTTERERPSTEAAPAAGSCSFPCRNCTADCR